MNRPLILSLSLGLLGLALLLSPYEKHMLLFSLEQALVSTALCVPLSLVFARAVVHKASRAPWVGRLFPPLLLVSFIMPSLVSLLGFLGLFGKSGWVTLLWGGVLFPVYGKVGIIVAHVFFFAPYMTLSFIMAWRQVPFEHYVLAQSLHLREPWVFLHIEAPALKSSLLIQTWLGFCLFFSSFTTVLLLGGGPQHTTLSVLLFEGFHRGKPLEELLPLLGLQVGVCLVLALVLWPQKSQPPAYHGHRPFTQQKSLSSRLIQGILLLLALLLALLPFLRMLPFHENPFHSLSPLHGDALMNSLIYGLLAGPLTALLALGMAVLSFRARPALQPFIHLFGSMNIIIPPVILAVGFWWIQLYSGLEASAFWMVCCGVMISLPFALKILIPPVHRYLGTYGPLARNLNLSPGAQGRLILFPLVGPFFFHASGLAAALTAGDVTAVLVFSDASRPNLSLLMYQQMGSYAHENALETAALLTALCLCLYLFYTLLGVLYARRSSAPF